MLISRIYAGDTDWTPLNWIMLGVSAAVCLLVFQCFVYIFNFSYALACLINGIVIAVAGQSLAGYLLGGAMAFYGARLLWFTWSRTRSESYAARVANVQREDAKLPPPVKVALWVQCTLLYTFHLFGVYIAALQGVLSSGVIAGAAIIIAGVVIEGLADAQKQAAKAVDRDSFVTSGLYARWRHPNYIGEIIVQVGLIVAGVSAVAAAGMTWGTFAAVLLSPVYIILLMLSECLRADDSMESRYGEREDFRAYKENSGSFLPRL
ncbi:MAG: DUF1295 domain-containing protein [Gammaproteobacteria bacterium]|nr:DUF1295 domain-containing protein [Gammaproteobacteria bacterium]